MKCYKEKLHNDCMVRHITNLHLIIENEKNELRTKLFEENPEISIDEMERIVKKHGEMCLEDLERTARGILTLSSIAELRKLQTRTIF